jgi:hypothetical protein
VRIADRWRDLAFFEIGNSVAKENLKGAYPDG